MTYRWGRSDKWTTGALILGILVTLSAPAYLWAQDNKPLLGNNPVSVAKLSYKDGVLLYRQGAFQDALEKLTYAYKEDPANANVRYYMAICNDKLVRYGDAVSHYQFVVEHGSDPQVVDYSQYRLKVLKYKLGESAGGQTPEESHNKSVALLHTPVNQSDDHTVAFNPTAPSLHKREVSVVPLKKNTQALMLEATLNNRSSGTFILDTGATYTSISREMAEELGLDLENAPKVRITTANGRIEVPKVTIAKLNVNGLEARDVEATVIDIRKGSSFSGLLGLSFIKKFKLTIDPVAGQIIFQEN